MVATMERPVVPDPRNRARFHFVPHYGDVPPGFAALLKPLWDEVMTIYKLPPTEPCHSCTALDALLLTLFDRGCSLMAISRAAGRSKTAAQKRMQRISIAQDLDLFYAGEDAPGNLMRQNRVGVGEADYSGWIGSIGETPPVEDERFLLVKTGQSKISHWLLEDKRVPGYPLVLNAEVIPNVLVEMGIDWNNYTQLDHPRHLATWPRASLGPLHDVTPIVAVPAHLLYVRGNQHVPQTPKDAVLSLAEPIRLAISESSVVRSLL